MTYETGVTVTMRRRSAWALLCHDFTSESMPDTDWPTDVIFIDALEADAIIGIYDKERSIRQVVRIDLELACDISRAAASDDIEDTLNYKALSKRVEAFVKGSSFLLVETLAQRTADLIFEEFAVDWLRLTLHKPGALSNSRDVGIRIVRDRRNR